MSFTRICCTEQQDKSLIQSSPLTTIGNFLLSTCLLSGVHSAKVEQVEGFVAGACPTFINLQQIIQLLLQRGKKKKKKAQYLQLDCAKKIVRTFLPCNSFP